MKTRIHRLKGGFVQLSEKALRYGHQLHAIAVRTIGKWVAGFEKPE